MTNKIRTNNFRLINAGFPKTASKSCSEGIAKKHTPNIIINLMHGIIYFAFEISVETIGL